MVLDSLNKKEMLTRLETYQNSLRIGLWNLKMIQGVATIDQGTRQQLQDVLEAGYYACQGANELLTNFIVQES